MSISNRLQMKAKALSSMVQGPYTAAAKALEIIPRTIAQNCGSETLRVLTALRSKHAAGGNDSWGINGNTGELVDMRQLGIFEPMVVKMQTYKTAIETAMQLLRIDDIVAGSK
jgi:T-complex protein 1 subunit gamma